MKIKSEIRTNHCGTCKFAFRFVYGYHSIVTGCNKDETAEKWTWTTDCTQWEESDETAQRIESRAW